ncbi:MAG: ATP-dependent helicase, partial [Candidatus Uhrbacteria bacterium]|nr:ATP-dependent helicase [Candidatus Uhrbacteria bacterium]
MSDDLSAALAELTLVQREAVEWNTGSLLVLAGPGSGKTRVLTTRIALLLQKTSTRILALTYTTKAADEMRERVRILSSGNDDRVLVGTFHSFCVQVLKQHGIHIGIKSDFSIYSREDDRRALLSDALRSLGEEDLARDAGKYLKTIDSLKSRLMGPASTSKIITGATQAQIATHVYEVYDKALKDNNILDFNSLIFETCRLIKTFPAVAQQYRRAYQYWLLDEFQDTIPAQYFLIKMLAGDAFKNVFVVADDDQIIYRWNGASYKQIENFRRDFGPRLIQLPTNFRCPPEIVRIANLLVEKNTQRAPEKKPLEAGKVKLAHPVEEHIRVLQFTDDDAEANGVAKEIASKAESVRNSIVILARYRNQLEVINNALREVGVTGVIGQRRDDFSSPHFAWLDASLRQAAFPLDQRNLRVFIESFNKLAAIDISVDAVISESETTSKNYIETWNNLIQASSIDATYKALASAVLNLSTSTRQYKKFVADSLREFKRMSDEQPENFDLIDDVSAWVSLSRDIGQSLDGNAELHEFTQELSMRSKEPPLRPNCVM